MSKLIPLKAWGERKFDPPPSVRTLRLWAATNRIQPCMKVGGSYRVPENAEYVPPTPHLPEISVLSSEDPVVNEIIRGQTEKRRPS